MCDEGARSAQLLLLTEAAPSGLRGVFYGGGGGHVCRCDWRAGRQGPGAACGQRPTGPERAARLVSRQVVLKVESQVRVLAWAQGFPFKTITYPCEALRLPA